MIHYLAISTLLVGLAITSTAYCQLTTSFPDGWQPASRADYSSTALLRDTDSAPAHITADFNGDGMIDDAWILLNKNNNLLGLFTLFATQKGSSEIIKLDERKYKAKKIYMGISLLSEGKHKTACGKGYWDCIGDEPKDIDLKHPGINYFALESGSSVYYWDSETTSFKHIWLSD